MHYHVQLGSAILLRMFFYSSWNLFYIFKKIPEGHSSYTFTLPFSFWSIWASSSSSSSFLIWPCLFSELPWLSCCWPPRPLRPLFFSKRPGREGPSAAFWPSHLSCVKAVYVPLEQQPTAARLWCTVLKKKKQNLWKHSLSPPPHQACHQGWWPRLDTWATQVRKNQLHEVCPWPPHGMLCHSSPSPKHTS